jgi:hypothetical protein
MLLWLQITPKKLETNEQQQQQEKGFFEPPFAVKNRNFSTTAAAKLAQTWTLKKSSASSSYQFCEILNLWTVSEFGLKKERQVNTAEAPYCTPQLIGYRKLYALQWRLKYAAVFRALQE